MPGITGSHHVLGVEHLLCQLRYRECSVLLGAPGMKQGHSKVAKTPQAVPGSERREPWHEEMKAREGYHVDSQLSQIGIELAREPGAEISVFKMTFV